MARANRERSMILVYGILTLIFDLLGHMCASSHLLLNDEALVELQGTDYSNAWDSVVHSTWNILLDMELLAVPS